MRHIKEIMIVAVCLMVLSFCVCTGFGIYFMYREGVQEYEDLPAPSKTITQLFLKIQFYHPYSVQSRSAWRNLCQEIR